ASGGKYFLTLAPDQEISNLDFGNHEIGAIIVDEASCLEFLGQFNPQWTDPNTCSISETDSLGPDESLVIGSGIVPHIPTAATMCLPSGSILVNNGTITLESGATLDNSGQIINHGSVIVSGAFINSGAYDNFNATSVNSG